MMDVGDVVDDFELPDETGTPRKLSDLLANGPVVLFFYPAAMTTGCTKESCHFRDLAAEFAAVGRSVWASAATRSTSSTSSRTSTAFDYPLLSDADGTVARMMGVARKKGPPKRVTFVIDQDRKVVEVVKSEIRMSVHADRALDALKQLQTTDPRGRVSLRPRSRRRPPRSTSSSPSSSATAMTSSIDDRAVGRLDRDGLVGGEHVAVLVDQCLQVVDDDRAVVVDRGGDHLDLFDAT